VAGDGDLSDLFKKFSNERVTKAADDAIKSSTAGWLARADARQRLALSALAFALAIGPLGQGLLAASGALFDEAAVPTTQQLRAVGWLFLIAAPVVLPILGYMFFGEVDGAGPARMSPRSLLFLCAFLAIVGASVAGGASQNLAADTYCYADLHGLEVHYEQQCRKFDDLGFMKATENAMQKTSNPYARAGAVLVVAAIFTIDARGALMVVAAALAAWAVGYLLRRGRGASRA
jgi:hypothetical protein